MGAFTVVERLTNLFGSDVAALGQALDQLAADGSTVTAEDVRRVVTKYLVDDKRNVVHVVAPDAPEIAESTDGSGDEG